MGIIVLFNFCGSNQHYYEDKLNEFDNLINIEKENFWNILEKYSKQYIVSTKDSITLNRIVNACLNSDNKIKVASYVNDKGIITETLPRNYTQFKGIDVSHQPHVKYIQKNKVRFIARKFMAVQGFEAISFIKPIVENNNFIGTLNILIEPHKLIDAIFNKIDLPNHSRRMVIQGDGVVLFSDLEQFRNTNIVTFNNYADNLAESLIKTIGNNKSGELSFFYNFENRRIKIFWKQIPMEKDKWTSVIINPI